MKKNFFIRINFFLFITWLEIVIITISVVISSYLTKFFDLAAKFKYMPTKYDSYRISIIFLIITITQHIYSYLFLKFIKPSIYSFLTLTSSQIISVYLAKKILTKTVLSKYPLSYIFLSFCLLLPFYDFIKNSLRNIKNPIHHI